MKNMRLKTLLIAALCIIMMCISGCKKKQVDYVTYRPDNFPEILIPPENAMGVRYASPETANIAKGYYSLAYYLTEEYPAEETIEQIQSDLKTKGCVRVKWSKEDMKVYTREGQGKGEFVLNKEMTEKYQKGIPDDLHLQQTKWRVNDRMQLGVSHEWLEDWITPNDNRLSITLTYKDTKEMNKLFVYYSVATSSTTRYGYVRKYKELHPELFEVNQDEETMSGDGPNQACDNVRYAVLFRGQYFVFWFWCSCFWIRGERWGNSRSKCKVESAKLWDQ